MRWEGQNKAEKQGSTGHDFKICLLCDALNIAATEECVICGWRGKFDYDPELVSKALAELKEASSDRSDAFFSEDVNLEEYLEVRKPPVVRIAAWIHRVFGF